MLKLSSDFHEINNYVGFFFQINARIVTQLTKTEFNIYIYFNFQLPDVMPYVC